MMTEGRKVTGNKERRGARLALSAMSDVLDGWIEGAKANHEALGHRGETDPCWERFGPEDIRRMIEDAANEVGA